MKKLFFTLIFLLTIFFTFAQRAFNGRGHSMCNPQMRVQNNRGYYLQNGQHWTSQRSQSSHNNNGTYYQQNHFQNNRNQPLTNKAVNNFINNAAKKALSDTFEGDEAAEAALMFF